MYKLKNFFKKLFTKTFFVVLILLSIFCVFFFWGWFEKQYDKAVGMYYVYKGDKAYKQEKLQDAIDYYNKGLELYPNHYEARYNLGNIYVVYEDYYAAADSYERAIEYNPNYTLARMNLGIISAEKLGDFDGAIKQYQAIIDSKKHLFSIPFIFNNKKSEKINRGIAYYNMGIAYREKAMYLNDNIENQTPFLLQSVKAYKNATKILKNDYNAQYNLSLAYHLIGDYQNAGLNYCKAIELQPMNYEAHYNLAILLRHLKMYKESLNELEKASVLISNDSENSNTSAYVFDILNDVSRILVNNNQYNYLVEKIDNEQPQSNSVTNVHGKIVATEALDRAMLKNFRTCETKDFFSKSEWGSKLRAIAYLCSYIENEIDFLAELKQQKAKIEAFCAKKNIDINTFHFEQNSSRTDYKPVLLQILNKEVETEENIIVLSPETLSEDESFRIWIQNELSQIGINIIFVIESKKTELENEEHISQKALLLRNRVKTIPSLPEIVEKTMQLVQDEKTSSARLGKVIAQDSGLTARVLRLANSSYYGFSRPIGSVQDAVTLLGYTTVRALTLSSSIFKILPTKDLNKNVFDYHFFWKHNLLTAIGAKFLSGLLKYEKEDNIFSAAILHDIGQIILALYDNKNYALAYARTFDSFDYTKTLKTEKFLCEVDHCEIGHIIASSWNLPEEILDVILYHHSPNESEKFKLSCIIVHATDILASLILLELPLDLELFDFELLNKFKITEKFISSTYDKLLNENINDIENYFQ